MNKLKLVALKIDDMHLAFKDGLNYIVGKNASGKTTIFNCIRYVIGLSKFNESSNVYSISLRACIDDNQLTFSRDAGDTEISISINDECHRFRPMSKELNDFLCEQLQPDYIFGREYENIFSLLNFFFLSEERSANRRQQWEAINSVCGINVSLLASLEKDIAFLKREVRKSENLQSSVADFLDLLKENLSTCAEKNSIDKAINTTMKQFFSKSEDEKELLIHAAKKLEFIKSESEAQLNNQIAEIESVFVSLKNFAGYERRELGSLESIIKSGTRSISYGEEIFSNFILILSIAKVAQKSRYNFPNLIINDNYLSAGVDNKVYGVALNILEDMSVAERGFQYIEFTSRGDLPKEHIVLDLNDRGVQHGFRG